MSELLTASFQEDLVKGDIVESRNIDFPFHGASLSKLFIASATLHLVECGQARLDRRLPQVTLEDLLIQSLRYSDNTATLKVANAIGRSRIQAVISGWSMPDTTILNPWVDAKNQTTARDVGHFLKNLMTGNNLEDFDLAFKMIGWLPVQRIRTHSGDMAEVRFKTGSFREDDFSYHHAAGFIFVDKSDIAQTFCFLTKAPDEGKETIDTQRKYIDDTIWWTAYQLPRRDRK